VADNDIGNSSEAVRRKPVLFGDCAEKHVWYHIFYRYLREEVLQYYLRSR